MLHLTSWSTSDREHLLYIHPTTLEKVIEYAQFKDSAPEAGGILLGKVRGPHVEIIDATLPSRWDKGSRTFFQRSARHHRLEAFKRWRRSSGIIRYLGEWHTHPEDFPTPSSLDIQEWTKLADARLDQRPLIAMIVGRRDVHLELVSANGSRTSLYYVPD